MEVTTHPHPAPSGPSPKQEPPVTYSTLVKPPETGETGIALTNRFYTVAGIVPFLHAEACPPSSCFCTRPE
jgi:hypothetical protein